MESKGYRRTNVRVRRVVRIEEKIHSPTQSLRSEATAQFHLRIAEDTSKALKHGGKALQLEPGGELNAVDLGMPTLHRRSIVTNGVDGDMTLLDQRAGESHEEPFFVELLP